MVATKSQKATKLTYAERVLGAFSQVKKEHRKRAVHLATLRAQVKKTAQAKKDVLGPQWSNWVGKAVHKLEDDGILASSEPTRNIILTPNGKKTIAAARRSLSISTHASPSPAQEVLIWKQVTQEASGRGVKRARHLSSGANHEEESEEEEVLSFLKLHNGRAKRAKTSLVREVKKPVSKMTKKELQAELKSLQQAHAEVLWRETSPLTDIDGDETETRLKQELIEREEEIEAIRRELAEAKRLATINEAQTQHGPSSRPSTPDLTLDFATSTPTQPNHSNLMIRSRSLLGVTRTHSGSFISDLSKQPTPAPSSPDLDDHSHNNMFCGADDDVFGSSGMHVDDDRRNADSTTFSSLATPATTPARATAVAFLKSAIQEGPPNSEVQPGLNAASEDELRKEKEVVVTLKGQITAQLTNIADLEDTIRDLKVAQITTADRLAQVTSDNTSFSEKLKDMEAINESLLEQLTTAMDEKSTAETALKATQASVEALKPRLAALDEALTRGAATERELQDHLSASQNEGERLRGKVSELDSSIETLIGQLQASELNAEKLRKELATSSAVSSKLISDLEVKEKAAAETTTHLTEARSSVALLSEDAQKAREAAAELKNTLDTTVSQLKMAEEGKQKLTGELTMKSQELQHMTSRLSTFESKSERLEAVVSAKEGEIQDLRSEIDVVQSGAQEAEAALTDALSKNTVDSANYESVISALRNSLSLSQSEVVSLNAQLNSIRVAHGQIQSQLDDSMRDLAVTKAALETEKLRASSLEKDIMDAIERGHETDEEMVLLQSLKEADETTIENLKDMFVHLRRTQMQSLEELDTKVVSAHPSPMPKRRSSMLPVKTA